MAGMQKIVKEQMRMRMGISRNKPTQSWVERAKIELEHEDELTIERAYELGRIRGGKEQKAEDHSEEHLNWILWQHHLWVYEMCHNSNIETLTFKEWIDKKLKEE